MEVEGVSPARLEQIKETCIRISNAVRSTDCVTEGEANSGVEKTLLSIARELFAEVERLRADAARLDAVDRLAAEGHDHELSRCLDMIQEGRPIRDIIDDAVNELRA